MKRRGPQPDVVIRLFDEDWQRWEFANGRPTMLPADTAENGCRRTLAVPARQVLASPLWIDGADPALAPEAAKLELEVRGLLSRTTGMQGVSLRLLPGENRTLAVAAVFPTELSESCPPADRFDVSPFLFNLPSDAVTLWREGEDYVAAVTRGAETVYWETVDRSGGAEELRIWLNLIVQRLLAEGVITAPPRIVSWVEGLPAARVAPAGCPVPGEPTDETSAVVPSLDHVQGDWKPASAHRAEAQRQQRERMRSIILAVVAGYLVLAAVLVLYAGILRWKASGLVAENARLTAEIAKFDPIRRDWEVIEPTVESAQFPLELLRGVVASLPAGNIHLTKFIIDQGRLKVDGEADSFSLATDFYNSLSSNEALQGITWDGNTNPTVGPTVTTFHAEGALPPSAEPPIQ
jgi:hypothetical protein